MKLIAIGDNVVDCYLHQKMYYPGGSAVNVAVGCKRSGAERVAYIGVFGNDRAATHIKYALVHEGVEYLRSRGADLPSSHPLITIDEHGSRIFTRDEENSCQWLLKLAFVEDDYNYIKGFDLMHTGCFSNIEDSLPLIRNYLPISFDFNERIDDEYLRVVCPYIKYAFLSAHHIAAEEERAALISKVHSLGVEIVGLSTGLGEAVFSENGKIFRHYKKLSPVIDDNGASDSFIAGFLTKHTGGSPVEETLEYAAACAEKCCGENGAFGYPKAFEPGFPYLD